MEPAMFSVASMFGSESGDDEENTENSYQERDHKFPGMSLRIREFTFHQVNANLLWPGASIFAEWIQQREGLVGGRRILELGSGTGALAIFLKKRWNVDITTSDYDDADIESNIKYNCELNGLDPLRHIRRTDTWGEKFPRENPDWDLIIASDILLYVKSYPHLIRTLCLLLPSRSSAEEQQSLEQGNGSCELAHSIRKNDSPMAEQKSESSDVTSIHDPAEESQAEEYSKLEATADSLALAAACTSESSVHVLDASPDKSHLRTQNPVVKLADEIRCLPKPCFLMSWRRRIPRQEEAAFFEGCRNAGFIVNDLGSRVFCIYRPS